MTSEPETACRRSLPKLPPLSRLSDRLHSARLFGFVSTDRSDLLINEERKAPTCETTVALLDEGKTQCPRLTEAFPPEAFPINPSDYSRAAFVCFTLLYKVLYIVGHDTRRHACPGFG